MEIPSNEWSEADRGGMRVLRGEAIVDDERPRLGRQREPRGERAMRVDRADDVSAPVKIENRAARFRVRPPALTTSRLMSASTGNMLPTCSNATRASSTVPFGSTTGFDLSIWTMVWSCCCDIAHDLVIEDGWSSG